MELFVKSFDIDDSTDETFDLDELGLTPVIDSNGRGGTDNRADYLTTAAAGHLWDNATKKWGSNTSQKTYGSDGRAEFDFRVGMQPGNNYRAVASVGDVTGYASVHVLNDTQPGDLGYELGQNGGALASEALTVWRRLWIENDSMEAIGTHQFGYKANDLTWNLETNNYILHHYTILSNTETLFELPYIQDHSSFTALENGKFIVQSVSHPVLATHYSPDGVGSDYTLRIFGNLSSIPANSGFRLYDDDDYGLIRPALPRNDLVNDEVVSLFKSSFILLVDGHQYNQEKNIRFISNHAPVVGDTISDNNYGIWDDKLDAKLEGGKSMWAASVVIGYQAEYTQDSDPNSDKSTEGATVVDTIRFSGRSRVGIVYAEAVRDRLDDLFRGHPPSAISSYERNLGMTMAHEIGHMPLYQQGNAHHAENGLMTDGGHMGLGGDPTPFSPQSVKRFRFVENWRQKN